VYGKDRYSNFSLVALKDFEFPDACITFVFNKKNIYELIFFTDHNVFAFNYNDDTKDIKVIYKI